MRYLSPFVGQEVPHQVRDDIYFNSVHTLFLTDIWFSPINRQTATKMGPSAKLTSPMEYQKGKMFYEDETSRRRLLPAADAPSHG